MQTRRGFLRAFGLGGAAGVVGLGAAYEVGVDKAGGEEKSMFNFTCACGNGFMGETPKKEGEAVIFDCDCGTSWRLVWDTDHFNTTMTNRNGNEAAT